MSGFDSKGSVRKVAVAKMTTVPCFAAMLAVFVSLLVAPAAVAGESADKWQFVIDHAPRVWLASKEGEVLPVLNRFPS